jgi:hypothetical protein
VSVCEIPKARFILLPEWHPGNRSCLVAKGLLMIPAGRQCSFWSSDGVLGNRPVPPPALPISPVNARRAAPVPTSFRVGRRYGRSADPGTPAAKIAIAFLLALLWTIAHAVLFLWTWQSFHPLSSTESHARGANVGARSPGAAPGSA